MYIVIECVKPEIDGGRFAVKRVIGEKVKVTANIFSYGGDALSARLLYRKTDENKYCEAHMRSVDIEKFAGEFPAPEEGVYYYTLEAWIDEFRTLQKNLDAKYETSTDLSEYMKGGLKYFQDALAKCTDEDRPKLEEMLALLTAEKNSNKALNLMLSPESADIIQKYLEKIRLTRYPRELCVVVERKRALFGSWYGFFPRSCPGKKAVHGTFADCAEFLPKIKDLGFNVVYFPPIHPIGFTNKRGKNKSTHSDFEDPGNPWAIGSDQGGHKSVNPQLGTLDDFKHLISKASELGIDVALELAFHCSPDHPYIKEHPEWFKLEQGELEKSGSEIINFNFDIVNRKPLWNELKSIVEFWIENGVKIFRIDAPYLKPFVFWEWLIREIKYNHPDVIFLAEAFARQSKINYLSKVGFTQSLTYFCWRNTKKEITEFMNEFLSSDMKEFFRPSFWPNTHDMIPENLQFDGRQIFMIRFVLAATLSSNCGIYGPAYELCVQDALPGKEEYNNSEKYEIKNWEWDRPGSIKDFISRVNAIRNDNPALQTTFNIKFHETDNDNIIAFSKTTEDLSSIIYVAINLDPYHTQSGWVKVPINDFGINNNQAYLAHDLLGNGKYVWNSDWNYIELNPFNMPAHIISIRKKLKKESDVNFL